jgi:hypothetical protein
VDNTFATRVFNDVPLMDVIVAVGATMVEPTARVDATFILLFVNVEIDKVFNLIYGTNIVDATVSAPLITIAFTYRLLYIIEDVLRVEPINAFDFEYTVFMDRED